MLTRLRAAMASTSRRGLPTTVLEVGAGEGGFVEPALAYGHSVTATEMSRAAIGRLQERYGRNDAFSVAFDEDGSLTVLGDRQFSLVVYASVLHHIPDYARALELAITRHLEPGGAVLTLQDPLWYPTLRRGVRLLGEASFLWWRIFKGSLVRGLRTRLRRTCSGYDDTNPSDTVEYHVVRSGVDQHRLLSLLTPRFEDVQLMPYWSTQSRAGQKLGETLGVHNTFGLLALGYRGAQ
jgi:SAM-dependent methyltransferase